jgi:hypothetical protein
MVDGASGALSATVGELSDIAIDLTQEPVQSLPQGVLDATAHSGLPLRGLFVGGPAVRDGSHAQFVIQTNTVWAGLDDEGVRIVAPLGRGLAESGPPVGPANAAVESVQPSAPATASGVRMIFAGSSPVSVRPHDADATQISFHKRGRDQGVPGIAYRSASYDGLYPGIAVQFTANDEGLKYQVKASDAARLDQFGVKYLGAEAAGLDAAGAVWFEAQGARFHDSLPRATQAGFSISCGFVERAPFTFGITCPTADPRAPILVDPLITAEPFGGSSADLTFGVASDGGGATLVAGYTLSFDFPVTANALQQQFKLETDAFVAKFDPLGRLMWATFIGGAGDDLAYGVAVGDLGRVFVVGYTDSLDFPTLRPGVDPSFNGTVARGDAFVIGLSSSGQTLLFTTFLGAKFFDEAKAVAYSNGSIFVCGRTQSDQFPTSDNAVQPQFGGGATDAFLARLTLAGSIERVTYLGGSGADACESVLVEASGDVWAAGSTASPIFPVGPPGLAGTNDSLRSAFFVRLDHDLARIADGAVLRSRASSEATALGDTKGGRLLIAGWAASADVCSGLVGSNSYHGGATDAFVLAFDVGTGQPTNCELFGGTEEDNVTALAVSSGGRAVVTGYTASADFLQTAGAAFFSYQGGAYDGFLLALDPITLSITYSTFLGGAGGDYIRGAAWNGEEEVVVAGHSNSTDFPRSGVQGPVADGGASDSFIVSLNLTPSPPSLAVTFDVGMVFVEAGSSAQVVATIASRNGYQGITVRPVVRGSSLTIGGDCARQGIIIPGRCALNIQVSEGASIGDHALTLEWRADGADSSSSLHVVVRAASPPWIQASLITILSIIGVALWLKRHRLNSPGGSTHERKRN